MIVATTQIEIKKAKHEEIYKTFSKQDIPRPFPYLNRSLESVWDVETVYMVWEISVQYIVGTTIGNI